MFWTPTKVEIGASVEILSGVVRVGPDHHVYGDPYEYAVSFSSIDGKTAVLKGLVSPDKMVSSGHVKAAVRSLKERGFEHVTWERKK